MTLPPGTQVKIHGQPATVLEYSYPRGRYIVRLNESGVTTTVTKIDEPERKPNATKKT